MKKVLFIFLTVFVAVLAFNFMDNTEAKIIKALESADTEMLVTFFDKEVQLELFEFDDFTNKETAKTELNKFFIQYPPEKFTHKHRGASKDGKGRYVIGELKTSTQIFRVNFLIQNELIVELSVYPKKNIMS